MGPDPFTRRIEQSRILYDANMAELNQNLNNHQKQPCETWKQDLMWLERKRKSIVEKKNNYYNDKQRIDYKQNINIPIIKTLGVVKNILLLCKLQMNFSKVDEFKNLKK